MAQSDQISLEGPVELVDSQLVLRIPLEAGGDVLARLAGPIGSIEGQYLKVVIQPWMAEKLRVGIGSLVIVDNEDGKFNITRSAKNDISPSDAV